MESRQGLALELFRRNRVYDSLNQSCAFFEMNELFLGVSFVESFSKPVTTTASRCFCLLLGFWWFKWLSAIFFSRTSIAALERGGSFSSTSASKIFSAPSSRFFQHPRVIFSSQFLSTKRFFFGTEVKSFACGRGFLR